MFKWVCGIFLLSGLAFAGGTFVGLPAISLSGPTVVTGILPGVNGGTGKSSWTLGSIPFATSGNNLTENNAKLFWDNSQNRLGVNTNTPGYSIDIEDDGSGVGDFHVGATSYAKFSFRSNTSPPDTKAYQMYANPFGNFHFGALNDIENFEVPIFDVFRGTVNSQPFAYSFVIGQPKLGVQTGPHPAASIESNNSAYPSAGSEVDDDGSGNISCPNTDCQFTTQLAPGDVVVSAVTGLNAYVVSVSDDYNFVASNPFAGIPGQNDTLTIYANPFLADNSFTGVPALWVNANSRVILNSSTDDGSHKLQVTGSSSLDSGLVSTDGSGNLTAGSVTTATLSVNGTSSLGNGGTVVDGSGFVTQYNYTGTVSVGIPAIYAQDNRTAQSAGITPTTIFAIVNQGLYRVCYVASITRVASSSAVLGGTNGFQITYTDADDSVVKTSVDPAVTSSINNVGTSVSGCLVANAKSSTNLQYSFGYTSVGVTSMQYNLHVRVEGL